MKRTCYSCGNVALSFLFSSVLICFDVHAVIILSLCPQVWCYMRNRGSRNKSEYDYPSNRSSPSPPAHLPPQRVYLYPQMTPTIHPTATLIQPDVTQIITNKACGECGTPVHTPPMRMKKGLLER